MPVPTLKRVPTFVAVIFVTAFTQKSVSRSLCKDKWLFARGWHATCNIQGKLNAKANNYAQSNKL